MYTALNGKAHMIWKRVWGMKIDINIDFLAISPPILEGFDFMQAELYCCGVENSTDWMNSTIWVNQTMETITLVSLVIICRLYYVGQMISFGLLLLLLL